MRNLNSLDLLKVAGGSSDKCDHECDSFKKDLQELMQSAANKIGDGADTLADKINALLEKHK